MLDTFPLARIATVPVPLKFTHARQVYEGAEPEGVASTDEPSVTSPLKFPVVPEIGLPDTCTVPVASGNVRVRSVLVLGDAIVNVPVPDALLERVILLMLFPLSFVFSKNIEKNSAVL